MNTTWKRHDGGRVQATPCGIPNRTCGHRAPQRWRLTRGVSADVADVLLRDAVLQQAHAHAVLPAQALFTLVGDRSRTVTAPLGTDGSLPGRELASSPAQPPAQFYSTQQKQAMAEDEFHFWNTQLVQELLCVVPTKMCFDKLLINHKKVIGLFPASISHWFLGNYMLKTLKYSFSSAEVFFEKRQVRRSACDNSLLKYYLCGEPINL